MYAAYGGDSTPMCAASCSNQSLLVMFSDVAVEVRIVFCLCTKRFSAINDDLCVRLRVVFGLFANVCCVVVFVLGASGFTRRLLSYRRY